MELSKNHTIIFPRGSRSAEVTLDGHRDNPLTAVVEKFVEEYGEEPRQDETQILVSYTTTQTIAWLVEEPSL